MNEPIKVKRELTKTCDVNVSKETLDAIIEQGYCHTRPESASAYMETLLYSEDEELRARLKKVLGCDTETLDEIVFDFDLAYFYN